MELSENMAKAYLPCLLLSPLSSHSSVLLGHNATHTHSGGPAGPSASVGRQMDVLWDLCNG